MEGRRERRRKERWGRKKRNRCAGWEILESTKGLFSIHCRGSGKGEGPGVQSLFNYGIDSLVSEDGRGSCHACLFITVNTGPRTVP